MGGAGHTPSTWLLGPTRIHNPNDISIGSAVSTDKQTQTDRPQNVGNIDRIFAFCASKRRDKLLGKCLRSGAARKATHARTDGQHKNIVPSVPSTG